MQDGPKQLICVGECMIEFFKRDDDLWSRRFAGDTLNVAWAARALLDNSDWKVGYLTRIGTDTSSNEMEAFIRKSGISTDWITRDESRSPGLYTIATDPDGERHFSYWRSNSAARLLASDADYLHNALSQAGHVYISGITLAILSPTDRKKLIATLGRRGQRSFSVSFDPNIRPILWESEAAIRETVEAVAALCDIVLPTFTDEAPIFEDANPSATRERYRGLGCPEIIVKNGSNPTLWQADGDSGDIPISCLAIPVDTTGAGDSFNGGYLAGRLRGQDVRSAVKQAQSVSALVVTVRGALADPEDIKNCV